MIFNFAKIHVKNKRQNFLSFLLLLPQYSDFNPVQFDTFPQVCGPQVCGMNIAARAAFWVHKFVGHKFVGHNFVE